VLVQDDRRPAGSAQVLGEPEMVAVQVGGDGATHGVERQALVAQGAVEAVAVLGRIPSRIDHVNAAVDVLQQVAQRVAGSAAGAQGLGEHE
jgi:hypothetical protein